MVSSASKPDRGLPALLARWALAAGLVYLILFVLFFIEFPLLQNSPLPEMFNDLILAMRNAALARLSIGLSLLYWLLIGGYFVFAGTWVSQRSSALGSIVTALGIGQLAGVAGNVLQLNSLGALASAYGTAGLEQPALLRAFSDLRLEYTSGFEVGGLLWAVALLVLAYATFVAGLHPRWLSILTAIAGLVALANFIVMLVAAAYDPPVVAELLLMLVFFGTTVGLWRRGADASLPG